MGPIGTPWPKIAEIQAALFHNKWTLVRGLMAQLQVIHAGQDMLPSQMRAT